MQSDDSNRLSAISFGGFEMLELAWFEILRGELVCNATGAMGSDPNVALDTVGAPILDNTEHVAYKLETMVVDKFVALVIP